MTTSVEFLPSFDKEETQMPSTSVQHESQQTQNDTASPQRPSSVASSPKSDKSQDDNSSQNSTEPDQTTFVSLKSIKSKEQIEIESKQNQEILTNLNFNIDDLFRKISSLTDQITTQLQPKTIHQRNSPLKISSPKKLYDSMRKQSTETVHQNFPQTPSNPLQFSYKSVLPQLQQMNQFQSSYKPIFFQPYRALTPEHSINMKLFQTGKSLGCGKFGEVVQCRDVKTGALFALKKIFKSVIEEYQMEEQLLTELSILKQINHPNIVKAYESFTDDFHIFIVMEYIEGPLLVKKLKCGESECKVIIRQVLQALKYLHANKITHRDIKPQNIILAADNVVKICDFGWAAQNEEKMSILCGTLDYVSPEMAKEEEYTEKGDLWNVGVLTYELIHGYAPFRGSGKGRIFERVKNLQYQFGEGVSEECKEFIKGYLKEQGERESIEWGLRHQFLKQQVRQEEQDNSKGEQQERQSQLASQQVELSLAEWVNRVFEQQEK